MAEGYANFLEPSALYAARHKKVRRSALCRLAGYLTTAVLAVNINDFTVDAGLVEVFEQDVQPLFAFEVDFAGVERDERVEVQARAVAAVEGVVFVRVADKRRQYKDAAKRGVGVRAKSASMVSQAIGQ